jgi:archaellum component FlaC
MDGNRKQELREEIARRLDSGDLETLLRVEDLLKTSEGEEAEVPGLFRGGISRRQMLAGTLAGGAVLVSTNLATGLVAGSLGTRAGQAVAQLESEAELIKLRGLLALYENLEQVGIDALLSTGLAAVSLSLEGLEIAIGALESGVDLVEDGVIFFESSFSAVRRGLTAVESLVLTLESRVRQLQDVMSEIQEKVSPLSDAVGSFFSSLVERIPGVGPAIVDALDRISELVGSLPDSIGQIRTRLLEPLREDWFTDDEDNGLKGRLLNPLQESLLEPLKTLLDELQDSIDNLQQQLVGPVEEALTERKAIKQQIADYKGREGIT